MDIFRKISKKIDSKRAKLINPPQRITIGVTNICNNSCKFCSYHGDEARGCSNVYNLPFMLDMPHFKRMVDMAHKGGVQELHICATGEPFANPHILEMMDYVIEKYGEVSIQTDFWKELYEKKDYLNEIVRRSGKIKYITTDIMSGIPTEHERIKKGQSFGWLMNCLQYISRNTDILLNVTAILTKENYKGVAEIIPSLEKNNIHNYQMTIVNLYSYDYSDFTSSDNIYVSTDMEITQMLNELKNDAEKRGIKVSIPLPADKYVGGCRVFWGKFQTWPVMGIPKEHYSDNMIPCACAAVVKGKLNSLGYLLEYDDFMKAWNSDKLVEIRRNLLKGIYPDEACKRCIMYDKEDNYYRKLVEKTMK